MIFKPKLVDPITRPQLYQSLYEDYFRARERGTVWGKSGNAWVSVFSPPEEIDQLYSEKLGIPTQDLATNFHKFFGGAVSKPVLLDLGGESD